MSITTDSSGRRSCQVEVVVPGAPEAVWRAIATGPGVSSWFVPTTFVGGTAQHESRPAAVESTFGPGVVAHAPVTAWDPPRRFAAQGDGWGGSPPIATEWVVEPRAGGTCLVRVVNSLVANSDEWNGHLEAVEAGWPSFFRILQIVIAHFPGQRSTLTQLMAPVPGPDSAAWNALVTAFALHGVQVGQRWDAPAALPALGGVVEYASQGPYDLLLRIDRPAPGVAAFGAFDMGGQSMVAMNLYFYGDEAEEAAADAAPRWRAWFRERFGSPAED